ncbi:hypothetical protein LTS18_002584, partial [Coniosporium uncinatum]
MALNWHFYEPDQSFPLMDILRNPLNLGRSRRSNSWPSPAPPNINLARTPAAWLKMQDIASGKEVIQFVKPGSHTFLARVYDPVMVVMKGADRSGVADRSKAFSQRFGRILNIHLLPLALALISIIALVSILMNYLLWNELPDNSEDREEDRPSLMVTTLPKSHDLDVLKLSACGKGHVVSVGLDRITSIFFFDSQSGTYKHYSLKTTCWVPPVWPIQAAAIDHTGTYLALCNDFGRVAIWDVPKQRQKQ